MVCGQKRDQSSAKMSVTFGVSVLNVREKSLVSRQDLCFRPVVCLGLGCVCQSYAFLFSSQLHCRCDFIVFKSVGACPVNVTSSNYEKKVLVRC